jgi:hypothetical protein
MRFCFVGIALATAVVLLLKLGEKEVCFGTKKSSRTKKIVQPPSRSRPARLPFLRKAQGLQVNR